MPVKKYVVTLSEEQRQQLERAAASNKNSVRERRRARILLLADTNRHDGAGQRGDGPSDAAILQAVRGTSAQTVYRVRRRFCERGLGLDATQAVQATLTHQPQQRRKARKLDGRTEAHLVALVCGAPPQGYQRWSLTLLASTLIEQGFVDTVSHETVRQALKKTNSSPG